MQFPRLSLPSQTTSEKEGSDPAYHYNIQLAGVRSKALSLFARFWNHHEDQEVRTGYPSQVTHSSQNTPVIAVNAIFWVGGSSIFGVVHIACDRPIVLRPIEDIAFIRSVLRPVHWDPAGRRR